MEIAPRSLRLKMAYNDRRFYQGRDITTDAVKCLINRTLREPQWGKGDKSANPQRQEPQMGRRMVA